MGPVAAVVHRMIEAARIASRCGIAMGPLGVSAMVMVKDKVFVGYVNRGVGVW